MTFLTPWTALIAAAATIPLLVTLYLLKLRRRPLRIGSTLLWRQTVVDLEVNAPFQRLRWSILLLLQMLILLALLAAMAQPLGGGSQGAAARLIVLLDRSASMNAMDSVAADGQPRSRFEEAREAGRRIIDQIGRDGAREVMLISFASTAQVVSPMDSRRDLLLAAIESIQPTDEVGNLAAALRVVDAMAGSDEREQTQLPDVLLISDGSAAAEDQSQPLTVRCREFRFLRVGPESAAAIRNAGVVSMGARRAYDDPAAVEVFVRFANASPQPLTTSWRLMIQGEPPRVLPITIPGAVEDGLAGQATATVPLEWPEEALITAALGGEDSLATDNAAAVWLPAPPALRIILVHADSEPDPFLLDALEAMQPAELRQMTQPAFESLDERSVDSGAMADLIVFDRVSAARFPGIGSITFGAAPAGVGWREPSSEGGRRIAGWDRAHPVMRHAGLDELIFAGVGALEPPPTATTLASGPEGPVIALVPARGIKHVVVGFPLLKSNWMTHVSLPVFLQNAMDLLTLGRQTEEGLSLRPGEPFSARAAAGATTIRIRGLQEAVVEARPDGLTPLPILRRVGVYELEGASEGFSRLPVSLLSDEETDIRPRATIQVNARPQAAAGARTAAPQGLWPWMVIVAAALLVLEWMVYCSKARQ